MSKTKSLTLDVLANIFMIDKDNICILLIRKKDEPYKGYWTLPSRMLGDLTIEDTCKMILYEKFGIKNAYFKQDYTFSNVDRVLSSRVIATSYVVLVNSISANGKEKNTFFDAQWFRIDEIPKMAYDYKKIIDSAICKLGEMIVDVRTLKKLFPSDFTLPELQHVCEILFKTNFDRRNFRKKFLNLIEDTGYKNDGFSGRPAKLYKFRDDIDDVNIF